MDKLKNENLNSNSFFCGNGDTNKSCNENISSDCIVSKQIHYNSCELRKTVNTIPINLNKCTSRFLKIRISLDHVCFDKEISICVILCDSCGKIVDSQIFSAILHKDYTSCCDKPCGTLRRKVLFVLPKNDVCRPLNLTAHIVANYTSPCEPDEDFC